MVSKSQHKPRGSRSPRIPAPFGSQLLRLPHATIQKGSETLLTSSRAKYFCDYEEVCSKIYDHDGEAKYCSWWEC